MSRRRARIARLRDLADRQELAARTTMIQSQNAVATAEQAKAESIRKTEDALKQGLPIPFRGALSRASVTSSARQDDVIRGLQITLDSNTESWDSQRQRASSLGKLFERIDEAEQLEQERVAEIELGDVVMSRFANAKDDQLAGRS